VKTYSSWDEGATSDALPANKRRDALHNKTMMLLRVSEKWVGEGDEAEDNLDLEEKLVGEFVSNLCLVYPCPAPTPSLPHPTAAR